MIRTNRLMMCLLLVASTSLAAICAPAPSRADWRTDLGVFRIGVVSQGNASEAAFQVEPFRLALEESLKMRVEVFPARDFPALIDAAVASRIEYAIFSASAYAIAFLQCECVKPLVTASSGDGSTSFRHVLISRQDGPADPEALKGKTIGMARTPAAGGLELALHELSQQGVLPEAEEGTAPAEGLLAFADSEAAMDALADARIDALLGWSSMVVVQGQGYSRGTLRRIFERESSVAAYRIIWQSSPVPQRTHAVRRNLDGEAETALRETLTAMFEADPVSYDAIEPVFGGGFLAARQGQFEALVAAMGARGLAARPSQ